MNVIQKSILWKLVLPVPIALVVSVLLAAVLLPGYLADNSREDAVASAKTIAAQFKTIRGYYTRNVIKKVLASGALKPSYDHKTMDDGVPLPATFIHDMSELLAEKDTTIKLYSPYPFPNRADRKLDETQQAAWDFLVKDPKGTFVRSETRDGREFVRVGIADTMAAQGCVDCHNSRADTPKDDWKLNDVRGVLEITAAIDTQLARGAGVNQTIIIVTIVLGILLTLITVVAARQVASPISQMTDVMGRLAKNETDVDIPGTGRSDEVGAMAGAVEVFRADIEEKRKLESEREEASRKTQEEKKAFLANMAEDFKASVGNVVDTVSSAATELESSAKSMSVTVGHATEQSERVSSAANSAAGNVQSVSSAADQLASSISEIGQQASESSNIAGEAVRAVEETNVKVQGLAQAAEKIGEVVALITDIADQTNLLALNATIEAARAGEAGKGFAVVASEVKNLANQTAKATEEIGGQIGGIQGAAQDAVKAIENIGKVVTQINEIAAAIAAAVEEQGAATQEISRNTEEAAGGTRQVTDTITLVTDAVGETGQSSSQVLTAASELSEQSEKLRAELDRFIESIRNA